MSFKRLLEMCDENIKKEIGDYYFISKSRIDELRRNFESQVVRIQELTKIINEQQIQLNILQQKLCEDHSEVER